MSVHRVVRRLAAILAIDMVSYSRHMEADEAGTIVRQKAHRQELIDPVVHKHGGRIVKTTGDGLLVEFVSVVDALESAVRIQRAIAGAEAKAPDERRIQYRAGINLGEIVIDGEDILGDGVNIAARLEGLAEPGGISIAANVYEQVVGKLDLVFDDLGERQVKNIQKPVHVYRVRPEIARSGRAEVPYAFEDYVLDPERRELTRGSDVIAVGPQVFDLLLYLVRNRDRVVSKDNLLDAVWRGRIVSESTLTSHINAARKAIGDSGQSQRLIRTIARKGFRFVGEVRKEQPSDGSGIASAGAVDANEPTAHGLALPDKPSIAALPFLNLSGDSEQDYFIDGVVEDVISALSRIRWLFVIARNSSFAYKGRAVDVKQVGRDLGVRYVLEGSMRKAANRVRITGQLIDATTGAHLWAERFEGTLDDIFELQDQVAESVVGAIAPQLERAEIERAKRKPTGSLDAYDYYLRGMANFHQGTRQAIDEALPLFHRAIELDPSFASAWGMAASCHYWRKMNNWMSDRLQDLAEGARLANRAVELGANDAVALSRGGHALAHFGGDLDRGIAAVDRALVLNPNLSAAWFLSGFQRISRGEHDDAIERFARAMRLSPLDRETFQMQTGTAMAHMFARRFDAASAWAEKASRELPNILRVSAFSAASHALAGRMDDARQAMQHVRRIDPTLRISNVAAWVVLRRPEDLATFVEGLRRAGLPE